MRRWLAVPLFAAIAALTSLHEFALTPAAFAQKGKDAKDKDTSDLEPFLTADGVELQGRFHRATAAAKGPIVVLLYPPGGERTMDNQSGEWKALTKRLNEAGYHVFRFDWRGHGKSQTIREPDRFWDLTGTKNQWTGALNHKYIKDTPGAKTKKPFKRDLSVKDISLMKDNPSNSLYMPVLAEDLAAVRLHLDKKNDDSEKGVSSSSIYVIAAGDAVALAMLWVRTEWDRPAVVPKPNHYVGFNVTDYTYVPQALAGTEYERAGESIAGAIWLSPSLPRTIPPRAVENWIASAPRMRDGNPMMFIWGENDRDSKNLSKILFDKALVGDEKAAKTAGLKILPPLDEASAKASGSKETKRSGYEVPKTALKGGDLLGDDAQRGTETRIIDKLNDMERERGKRPRRTTGFETRYFINLGHYGVLPPL